MAGGRSLSETAVVSVQVTGAPKPTAEASTGMHGGPGVQAEHTAGDSAYAKLVQDSP